MNSIKRYEVENEYEFRKWMQKIPALHFKPEWNVKIIPPFGGAIARFTIDYNNRHISCYLDCYDELGYYGKPYWEIYPYTYEDGEIDVFRCDMEDTYTLITKIEKELNNNALQHQ